MGLVARPGHINISAHEPLSPALWAFGCRMKSPQSKAEAMLGPHTLWGWMPGRDIEVGSVVPTSEAAPGSI